MFCENCGAEIKEGTKCSECGKEFADVSVEETVVLTGTPEEMPKGDTPAPKSKKKFPVVLIIILIIAVLLLPLVLLIVLGIAVLGVGGVLALFMRVEAPLNKPNADNQITHSETAQISEDMLGNWTDLYGNRLIIKDDGSVSLGNATDMNETTYEVVSPHRIRVVLDDVTYLYNYTNESLIRYTDGELDGTIYTRDGFVSLFPNFDTEAEEQDIPYDLSELQHLIKVYEHYDFYGSVCECGNYTDVPQSAYDQFYSENPDHDLVGAFDLCPITCCHTQEEADEHVHEYMGSDFKANGFIEHEGTLYYVVGGKGGMAFGADIDENAITRTDYNKLTVEVMCYDSGLNPCYTRDFEFEYIDGSYKIVNISD